MKNQLFLLLVCVLVSCILTDEIKKDLFIRKDDHCGHKKIIKRFRKSYEHSRNHGCNRYRYGWRKNGCFRRRKCHRDHDCGKEKKKIIKIIKIYKKRDCNRHHDHKRRCYRRNYKCHHDKKGKKKIIKIIKIYKKRDHKRRCNCRRNKCRRHHGKDRCCRRDFWRNKSCH